MEVEYLHSKVLEPDFLREELHVFLPSDLDSTDNEALTTEETDLNAERTSVVPMVVLHLFTTQLHTMSREADEPMLKCLKRAEITLRKALSSKSKKGKNNATQSETIGFNVFFNSQTIDISDKINRTGWLESMVVQITGLGKSSGADLNLTVRVCPPEVKSLCTLPPKAPLAGLPIIPRATVRYGNAVEILWFQQSRELCAGTDGDGWEAVSSSPAYVPPQSAVGCKIKVYATPIDLKSGRRGRAVVYYVAGVVEAFTGKSHELITHFRRAFNSIPRHGELYDHQHADRKNALEMEESDSVNKDQSSDEGGLHFLPLFGPGLPSHASFLNDTADKCTESKRISNTSDYHMGRVALHFSPFDLLHNATALYRRPSDVRVVCYNILAEPFATSPFAVKQLFPYCQSQHLASEYRSQLLIQELHAYDADIILLQECDAKFAANGLGLLNVLDSDKGRDDVPRYEIYYTGKDSNVPEGCCTLVNSNAFAVEAVVDVHLGQALRLYLESNDQKPNITENIDLCETKQKEMASRKALRAFLQAHTEAWDVLTQRLGMIGQITIAWHKHHHLSHHCLCVANTHLFYHPDAGYARLLQTHILTVCLFEVTKHMRNVGSIQGFTFPGTTLRKCPSWSPLSMVTPVKVSVMLAGDLNSTLETPTLEYLLNGVVSPTHGVWDTLHDFRWGRKRGGEEGEIDALQVEEVSIDDKELAEDLRALTFAARPELLNPFRTAIGKCMTSASGYPQFTNYTPFFKDILDYIFITCEDSGIGCHPLRVLRTAPFPNERQLGARVGLPNLAHPSDHVALALDLCFE